MLEYRSSDFTYFPSSLGMGEGREIGESWFAAALCIPPVPAPARALPDASSQGSAMAAAV